MNDLVVVERLDAAMVLLDEARTIQETKHIVAMARGMEIYLSEQHASEALIDKAHVIRVYALRKLGELIKLGQKNGEIAVRGGIRGSGTNVPRENIGIKTLPDIGIDRKISSLAQRLAGLSPERLSEVIERKSLAPHIGANSGENEWFTPLEIIAQARAVLGKIDLDPASHEEAQLKIQAREWFSKHDDGLTKEWHGRVWLNPPYSFPLIAKFIEKLIQSPKVTAAITLTNNATETEWGQLLLRRASVVCFPRGRLEFWEPGGKPSAPLQGQMFCYIGLYPLVFLRFFEEIGVCYAR